MNHSFKILISDILNGIILTTFIASALYASGTVNSLFAASDTKTPVETTAKKSTKKIPDAKPKKAIPAPKGPVPKGMPVEVIKITPEIIQVWKQYSGHIVAVDQAEIRPQVSGRITELRFKDGQHVNKGDILFVIDPRPFEAALKQAEATLATAKTKVILAEKDFERAKKLVGKKAVSERFLDERANNFHVAQAQILGAEALVDTAKINLDYAYVKAPITGKVSRAEITEGNLLQSGQNAPLLTSIVATDKVYVDFEVDEQTYISSVRQTPAGQINKIPVRLQLDGDDNNYEGFIHNFDNRIDPSTGTIRGRSIFNNPTKLLLPGMSVSVMMGSATYKTDKKIVLTERAIGTDQDRKFVYIVNEENKATYREVKLGQSISGRRIILSGLKAGDLVITEGIIRIRPNILVTPKIINVKTTIKQNNTATKIAQD